jgi:hypothetical protein
VEKNMFHEMADKIEVPKDDVLKAIQSGIRKGSMNQVPSSRKRRVKILVMSTAAAAITLVSSGFLFPSVSHVMADIPFLAKLYEHDKVATDLASQKLITELNESATFDGIDVTVTDAYYDGAMIGVTFDVKGNVEKGDEIYAFYEMFDRDPNIEETMELVELLPDGDGYKGHIQLSYPRAELPAETTLPLNFIGIGKIDDSWKDEQGKWNFDVPIKQLPFEKIALDQKIVTEEASIQFNTFIKGQSSTAIEYTVTYPEGLQNSPYSIALFDDKGREIIGGTSDAKLGRKTENGIVIEQRRKTIPGRLNTSFIEIQPSEMSTGEKLESVKINVK